MASSKRSSGFKAPQESPLSSDRSMFSRGGARPVGPPLGDNNNKKKNKSKKTRDTNDDKNNENTNTRINEALFACVITQDGRILRFSYVWEAPRLSLPPDTWKIFSLIGDVQDCFENEHQAFVNKINELCEIINARGISFDAVREQACLAMKKSTTVVTLARGKSLPEHEVRLVCCMCERNKARVTFFVCNQRALVLLRRAWVSTHEPKRETKNYASKGGPLDEFNAAVRDIGDKALEKQQEIMCEEENKTHRKGHSGNAYVDPSWGEETLRDLAESNAGC